MADDPISYARTTQVRLRRGTTAQIAANPPIEAEPFYDLTEKRIGVGGTTEIIEQWKSQFLEHTADATDAVPRNLQEKLTETVSVKDFGAVGDGVTDDTVAIQLALSKIQDNFCIKFPAGQYIVTCPHSSVLALIEDAENAGIIFDPGAEIVDNQTYTKSPIQTSKFLRIENCKNFFIGTLSIRSTVVYDGVSSGVNSEGLIAVEIGDGCRNINISIYGNNLGLSGVTVIGTAGVTGSDRVIGINVAGSIKNTRYGYNAQFNGDDANISLITENVGRPFFVYGVSNNRIKIRGKSSGCSRVGSYEGYGSSNIKIDFSEDEGTHQPAQALIAVFWGDSTPAENKNIAINIDCKEDAASPWGDTVVLEKYLTGTTPDTTGRGHQLNGFLLQGRMHKTVNNHFSFTVGAFASPDSMRCITNGPLCLSGGMSFSSIWTTAVDVVNFYNVSSDGNVYSADGNTAFFGCEAQNFTSSSGEDAQIHRYIGCKITTGNSQNYNKSFFDTVTPKGTLNMPRARNTSLGYSSRSTTSLSGDLTASAQNIFRVPSFTQGVLYVKYFLVFNQAETNPANRRETFGIKSFTITVNSAGSPLIQSAVADAITEKTKGSSPAVVTLNVAAGSASLGAYINFICTNYNDANSLAFFECELIGFSDYPSLIFHV